MDLDPVVMLLLLAVVGAVTSVVNTFAGGGSFIVLPLLMAFGIPAGTANGTVRIGIAIQSLSSSATFYRRGVRDPAVFRRLVGPMCVGALVGAWLATELPDEDLRPIFGGLFLAWALLLVVRPGRFLHPPKEPARPGPGSYLVALVIGLYGGFLQAGVGFPLMALLISGLGYPPVRANAVKVLFILVYTALAIPVFAVADQVAWPEALALAAGSVAGGWMGARWHIHAGPGLVRWFVVVMVTVGGISMVFG